MHPDVLAFMLSQQLAVDSAPAEVDALECT